ncbi:MAG: hypothetical protein ABSD10_02790 [Candidatus Saccharimonadales bacterium]|jgi:hypothetical protein
MEDEQVPANESTEPELDTEQPGPQAEPGSEPKTEKPAAGSSHWRHWHRFKNWYKSHKKWSIPATIIILLLIIGGVPWTRYQAAGLVLKKSFTIEVSDSTANTPVSGATVSITGVSGTTNGSGKVTLHGVKAGHRSLQITKKYYQSKQVSVLVPILNQKSTPDIPVVATGRQVKIKITNLISGKVLADATIEVADTTSKTGSDGTATIVVPANASSQKATLNLSGYNNASVTLKTSSQKIEENDFKLTPAGKIYFLSKRTGSLDVMKANLDGSDAQTVVAATGNEEAGNTFLLQSPDGQYVALVSKRTTTDAMPQLYVLAAADDKLLQADSGNAIFNMIGWIGDSLIYTVARQDLPDWQQGLNKLKSYDATTGRTTLLDQSAGSDATTNANENYNTVVLSGNDVVYGKTWSSGSSDPTVLNSKQDSLQIISVDGQNHQSVGTYPANDIVQFVQHSPVGVYIMDESADMTITTYFDYIVGSTPKQVTLSSNQLYASSYTYLFSPSGNQTFWSEPRDGKLAVILGDASGSSPKTILNLSDYSTYGWYTDNYLLVSKGGSELYIMDTHGDTPLKVTDYEPAFGQ